MGRNAWNAKTVVNIKPDSGDGTLVAEGGWANGWGLFIEDGKPVFVYLASDHDPEIKLIGPEVLDPGRHVIIGNFEPDAKPGTGGTVSLMVDGTPVASKHSPMVSTFLGQSASVGRLGEQAIGEGYQPPFAYEGDLESVTVSVK
jgi:arylsulfatase